MERDCIKKMNGEREVCIQAENKKFRYSFLLVCYNNSVRKMRRFSDIRLQKCCDLEIQVRRHLRSLKVVPFNRLCMVSYYYYYYVWFPITYSKFVRKTLRF